MARDVESLILSMSADLRKFEREMGRARSVADKRLLEIERRALQSDKNLSRIMDGAGRNMVRALQSSLAGIAPTLAAAFSAQQVIAYADSYTSLQNRLRAAGLEGDKLAQVEDRLYAIANRNGLEVEATAELYSRASLARQRLGASEEDLQRLVSGTAAALKVQGTSAGEASGPLLQLGQALSGNKVQAEEFNSLIDGLPVLLQAAAKGSDRFGGDVAKLTEQVKAGKVSSQEFFQALLAGFPALEQQAGSATTTVSSALQTLDNQLGRFVGQTDSSLGATQRMAQGIEYLADHLDDIVPVVGALATIIGTGYVASLAVAGVTTAAATIETARYQLALISMQARATGATSAQVALNAAMAANPIGLVITVVAALAAGLFLLSQRYSQASVAGRELDDVIQRGETALEAYEKAQIAAKNATRENAQAARNHAAALREEAQEIINVARLNAAKRLQEAGARVETATSAARTAASAAANNQGGNAGAALAGGSAALARSAIQQQALAQERYGAALREQLHLEQQLSNIDRGVPRAGPDPTTSRSSATSDDGKGKGSGSNAEQIARARAELALEEEIARARATGDDAAIKAAEERQALAQLTRQYEQAGYEDAAARAMEQLGLQNQALRLTEEREASEARAQKVKEQATAADERAVEAQRLLAEQTRDRLGYEAELARISGDDGAIRNAERRLFIEERTLEILRLKLAATEAEARAMAGGEFDEIDRAQTGRDMASDIVSALRSDSIWEEAGRRFQNAAWDGVEDFLAQVFKSINFGGGSGGGDIGSIIASMFSKRALGGPVRAGQPYIVGERKPEVFVPSVGGTIIPSVNAAMNRAQQARGSRSQPVIVQLSVEEGAMFAPKVQAISGQVAVQTTAAGVAYGQGRTQQAAKRGRQRLV